VGLVTCHRFVPPAARGPGDPRGVPLLVIGGAGSEPLASAVGRLLGAPVVRLSACAGDDDVHSVDLGLLQRLVDDADGGDLVIVAGAAALALPPLRWATCRLVDAAVTPDPAAVAALTRGRAAPEAGSAGFPGAARFARPVSGRCASGRCRGRGQSPPPVAVR
jgi:hypothetical protein